MKANVMKVLHVLGSLDRGGAELRTIDLQRELGTAGIQFDYGCLAGREGSIAPIVRDLGSRVYTLSPRPTGLLKTYRILRRGNYDAVHSHVATASGVILAIAKAAGVPRRIAHFRSDGDSKQSTVRRRVQRWLGRRLIAVNATSVIGVSPGALEFAGLSIREARRMDTATVVANGVDTSPVRPRPIRKECDIPRNSLLVMHVGKPTKVKRRRLAASAVLNISGAHIVFVGRTGEDIEELRQQIPEEDASRVHILGVQDDVRRLIAAADVLLLPSSVEGLPGVVLEALSVGTPVVTSALSGAKMISDTVKGVTLVPVDAEEGSWSQSVADAKLHSEDERSSIVSCFADSRFTLSAAAAKLRDVYKR